MYKPYLFSPPGWVLRPSGKLASFDCDFTRGLIYGASSFDAAFTTVRASSKYIGLASGGLKLLGANVLPRSDLGLLPEQAATNLALYSRDFTNAAWVKVSTTAALDQTGIDGAANSASSLLATGANATVLQTPGLTSAQRTFSVYIKRITGTGAITLTDDGVTYGSDISGSLSTSAWFRTSITATAIPVFGVKLATSGDKIAVDFAQDEAGAFYTSPILTTSATATRASDDIRWAGATLPILRAATGWARAVYPFGSKQIGSGVGLLQRQITPGDSFFVPSVTTGIRALSNSSGAATATIGGSGTWSGRVVGGVTWDAIGVSISGNAGTVAAGAIPFTANPTDVIFLGSTDGSSASSFINNYIERITFGTGVKLSNVQLQAIAQ